MKTNLYYLPALFLFLYVSSACCQSWPNDHAEWYLHHGGCINPQILTHIQVAGTEWVEDNECTVLNRTVYSTYGSAYESEHHVFFNGDTVFWYYQDAFYPLLCFNLDEGDVWYPLPLDTLQTGPGCTYSGVVIDNKSTVDYNGQSYRQITISSEVPVPDDWEDAVPSIVWQGTFNERTFVQTEEYASSWFFPVYNICNAIVEWDCPTFACYSDNELNINVTGEACDQPLSVSIAEHPPTRSSLFPNPVKKGSTVRFESNRNLKAVQIFNVVGHLQRTVTFSGSAFSANLDPGQYLILSEFKEGPPEVEKLVVLP